MNALLNHKWGVSPAQDRVWTQVTGAAPGRAVRRLLMVLNFQAFIDESVSNVTGEFVLAGHIATAENWARFTKDWEPLLQYGTRDKHGNLHFKMSEMAQNKERMAGVPLFAKVIDEHVYNSISCRMNLEDFVGAQQRFKSFATAMRWTPNWGIWKNPYYFCFRGLMDAFHRDRAKFHPHIPLDEKVDFIFDDRSEKRPIYDAWDEILARMDSDVRARYGATPRFENDQDREFLPLQAADFWAWWVREWYEEDVSELPTKMGNFDYGTWRGRKRRLITIFLTEDKIFEELQALAVQNFAEGNFIGGPIA